MKIKLKQFILNKHIGVYLHNSKNEDSFNYSDGEETEKSIFNKLQITQDRSIFSEELSKKIDDWPTEYHFSPLRHNLLRHIQFNENHSILELGCGCGAITRQIGERGASVDAVDGSFIRAKIASLRCSDLPKVRVYVSDFKDVEFDNKYDFVLLIGVLEYSSLFFKTDDPFTECIQNAKSALKPNGKLIIAIENRLGLKYFMGLNEDHVDKPFYGIQDLYSRNQPKTFGKVEIHDMLLKNGFQHVEFQYPFPDYKIPEVVFFEKAFTDKAFLPSQIISQYRSRDYSNLSTPLFSESIVWPVIEANNLIPDLSNSFLIIADESPKSDGSDSKLLAVKYSVDRKKVFNTKTEFIKKSSDMKRNEIIVKKTFLISGDKKKGSMVFDYKAQAYIHGKILENEIVESILSKEFGRFLGLIKKWIDFLVDNAIKKINGKDIYTSTLKSCFIDCIPSNIVHNSSGLVYIDNEWKYQNKYTIKTLLFKFWNSTLIHYQSHLSINENNPVKNFDGLALALNITYDEDDYTDYRNVIANIMNSLYD